MQGLHFENDDLVFSKEDGSPITPNAVTSAWVRLAKRSDLQGIRLHDERHTHAPLMLKQGIHPKIVQERLGHSTTAITLDTYSHIAPGLQEAAAMKFFFGKLHQHYHVQKVKTRNNDREMRLENITPIEY